ncbi:MAG: hypothetical protein JNK82_01090 [Myxococcaceae bacterium]|nr:hypothetical protein [Myxococcaceae bacterium]
MNNRTDEWWALSFFKVASWARDHGVLRVLAETPEASLHAEAIAERCGVSPRTARVLIASSLAVQLIERVGERYRLTSRGRLCVPPGGAGT